MVKISQKNISDLLELWETLDCYANGIMPYDEIDAMYGIDDFDINDLQEAQGALAHTLQFFRENGRESLEIIHKVLQETMNNHLDKK